jgi:hypothetical protein
MWWVGAACILFGITLIHKSGATTTLEESAPKKKKE